MPDIDQKTSREKMVISAVEVLRERGAAGVTIDEVLERSGAPRGSVYHHFPDGRTQLIAEALAFSGDSISDEIDRIVDQGSAALFRRFTDFWKAVLVSSDYDAGCPVVAVAVVTTGDGLELNREAARIFDRWKDALASAFVAEGFEPSEAGALGTMSLASIEGAVILCRAHRSIEPLEEVSDQLEKLIDIRRGDSLGEAAGVTA